MRKIKNWNKFNEKPFKVLDEEPKKGDYFIFNDDGRIRRCSSICRHPAGINWINDTLNSKLCKKIEFDDSIKMNFEEEKIPIVKTTPPNLKKGDSIYFLYDYDLMNGTVESIGLKNVKINFKSFGGNNTYTKIQSFDKVAEPDESICIVWERWRGSNGRGGYRIERELYPEYRREAKKWPYQALVDESHYGELSNHQRLDFIDDKKKY